MARVFRGGKMTLEELEIVVKANVEEATKNLEDLKNKLNGVTNDKKVQNDFDNISKEAEDMGKNAEQAGEQLDILGKVGEGALGGLSKKMLGAKTAGKDLSTAINEIGGSLSTIGLVAMGVVALLASIAIKIKLVKTSVSILVKLLKSIATPAIAVMNRLFTEFARIIKDQVARALQILKAKMEAGINNLVQVSDSLNEAMSSLQNNLTQAGNALATAVAPAIEAIIPIMNNLLQLVISVADGFAQITASVLGNATTYKRATKVNDDYAKSLKGTSKAVKGVLASFDELNVISEQSGSGVSAEDMFEDAPIESKILDLTTRLKELWNTNNIEGLEMFGEEIGKKIKKQIEELPAYEWGQNIGEMINKALALVNGFLSTNPGESIGKTLADIILGFFNTLTPEQVGRFIANIINNAFGLVLGFVKQMNDNDGWKKIGLWLADTINEAIENINEDDLAEAVSGLVVGLLETIKKFLEGLDWKDIGFKIGKFLAGIDWLTILKDLLDIIALVWGGLESIRKGILDGIFIKIFENIKAQINEKTETLKDALEKVIIALGTKALDFLIELEKLWVKVKKWYTDNIEPVTTYAYWEDKLKPMREGIEKAFKDTFNGIIGIVEKAVNYVIRKLNTIRWDIPDWVPGIRRWHVWV